MAQTVPDFASARQFMVDSQLRPTKVTHAAVLEAMRRVPREKFLPPALYSVAYADQDVDLGHGRWLIAPLAFARLAQALAPVAGERILVVGAGVGYGAAVLAACGARVTALESDARLIDAARSGWREAGVTVALHQGDLAAGVPGAQVWDAILIEGMVDVVPPSFATQLRESGGRLVTVQRQSAFPGAAATGVAIRGERQGASLVTRPLFDCRTAVLPGFETVPEFQF
ncbi:protein-L-isoaspartate O-methyltransferase family protein [Acidisoma sp. 7E03]